MILESMFRISTETSLWSLSLLSATFFRPYQLSVICCGAMRVTELPFFVSWLARQAQKRLSSEKKGKLALLVAEPSRNWFAEALTYANETRLVLTSECFEVSKDHSSMLFLKKLRENLDFYSNSTLCKNEPTFFNRIKILLNVCNIKYYIF